MTKSLLQQVMVRPAKPENDIDVNAVIQQIQSGYMFGQDPKHQKTSKNIF